MVKKKLKGFLLGTILCSVLLSGFLGTERPAAYGEVYEYDEINRVKKVTYDDGSYVTYSYDKNGNITQIKVYPAETSSQQQITTEKETTHQPQTKKENETTKSPKTSGEGETSRQQQTTKGRETTHQLQTKKENETTKSPKTSGSGETDRQQQTTAAGETDREYRTGTGKETDAAGRMNGREEVLQPEGNAKERETTGRSRTESGHEPERGGSSVTEHETQPPEEALSDISGENRQSGTPDMSDSRNITGGGKQTELSKSTGWNALRNGEGFLWSGFIPLLDRKDRLLGLLPPEERLLQNCRDLLETRNSNHVSKNSASGKKNGGTAQGGVPSGNESVTQENRLSGKENESSAQENRSSGKENENAMQGGYAGQEVKDRLITFMRAEQFTKEEYIGKWCERKMISFIMLLVLWQYHSR